MYNCCLKKINNNKNNHLNYVNLGDSYDLCEISNKWYGSSYYDYENFVNKRIKLIEILLKKRKKRVFSFFRRKWSFEDFMGKVYGQCSNETDKDEVYSVSFDQDDIGELTRVEILGWCDRDPKSFYGHCSNSNPKAYPYWIINYNGYIIRFLKGSNFCNIESNIYIR